MIPRVETAPHSVETSLIDGESYIEPAHPGRISSIPGSEILPFFYNSNNPGAKAYIPRVDAAPQGVEHKPHWVIADWLGPMEPARGESCPLGQRRGPAAPGEDNFPSPVQISLHIYATPTTRRRKRGSLESIPHRRVWKPRPHWLVAGWMGLMEQRAAVVASRDNVEISPHPGSIGSHPRIQTFSLYLQLQQPGDVNGDPPGRYRPQRVETPTQLGDC